MEELTLTRSQPTQNPVTVPGQVKMGRKNNPTEASKIIIRQLGLKVTDQRLVILETLMHGRPHVTAQEVFEIAIEKFPEIGFATVYRFLRTLTEHGFISEVRMGGLPARYEWALKKHHDHISCTGCHRIFEFENDEIERLQERVAEKMGFTLTGHLLELYGVCPACKKKTGIPEALPKTNLRK